MNEALTDTRNNLTITKEKLIESQKVEKNLKSFYGTLCGIFSEAQSDLSNLKIEIKKNMISDSKRRPSVSVSETEQSKKPTALSCVVDYISIRWLLLVLLLSTSSQYCLEDDYYYYYYYSY